jgi:hypothetical protein
MGVDEQLRRYRALLQKHDWTYAFSDDQRAWRRGEAERKVIEGLQPNLDPHFTVWNEMCNPAYMRSR